MNERMGSMIWNLVMLAAFVYALLIMRGIVKPTLEIRMLQKPKPLIKILVYFGIIIFAALVAMDIMGK